MTPLTPPAAARPMSRPQVPPPLPAVDVPVPAWPVVARAHRRLDTVRSCTGRVATLAGAALAAAGLFTPALTGAGLLATAVATCVGVGSLRRWKTRGHQLATATVLYVLPGVGLAGLLAAERAVTGHWGEALALTAWTTGTWAVRPARAARRMVSPAPPPPAAPVAPRRQQEAAAVDAHPAARWWAAHVAVDGETAPGTLLEDVQQTGPAALRAVIRSVQPGRPVPDVSIRRLSALMDVPEDQIAIGPVPGRGASVRLLTIGQPEAVDDPQTMWAKRIAPLAMPGAVLTGIRTGPAAAAHAPLADLEAGQ